MRAVFCLFMLVVVSLVIRPARADSSTGSGRINGEQLDNRVLLVENLLEASNLLARYSSKQERILHFQLVAFASRLSRSSTSFDGVSPDEPLRFHRQLVSKEKEVKEHLAKVQERRQYYAMRAARFKEKSKGLMPPPNIDLKRVPPSTLQLFELGKKFKEQAQRFEEGAREAAEEEAKIAREVSVRESVSRLLGEIAKEIPAAKKQTQPVKK